MSTIEDKLLDGPRIHYCDADNDDLRLSEENISDSSSTEPTNNVSSLFTRPPSDEEERLERISQTRWRTNATTNTGPKGVIEDYKKKTFSSKELQKNDVDELDAEFQELLNDDSILQEYISKRISQSLKANNPVFGQVYTLQTGDQLLDAIDKENPNVLVIVHIYSKYSRSCTNLNRCLNELSKDLSHIKFVTLDASVTALSGNFKENGVPALLAYKKGDLVKSLVQLEELLDKNFDCTQVKELLKDNGLVN